MSMTTVLCLRVWCAWEALCHDVVGQDLIEYALMAGLVATGVVTMSPSVATSFATVWSKVNSVAVLAAAS